jgi:hypothetical protein
VKDGPAIEMGDIDGAVASEDAPIVGESWGTTAVKSKNLRERDFYRSVGNNNRPALIMLTTSIMVLLALILATRGGAVGSDFVLARQSSDSSPQTSAEAIASIGEVDEERALTEAAATVVPAESADEIAAVVRPADTIAVSRSGPGTSPTTQVLGEEQSPDDGTTTTTNGEPLGTCVFDDGTIASPLRAALCTGFFTLDNAEANRIAARLEAASTPTSTTDPSPTSSTSATTSSTTTVPPTASTTTITVTKAVPPITSLPTGETQKKRRGKDRHDN